MVVEHWKDIPTALGYQASTSGRVRRVVPETSKKYGKTLKTRPNNCGYHYVSISVGGKQVTRYVHHLVAEAFLGPRPDGYVVSHENDNKDDNNLSNLLYRTYSDNVQRAYKSGVANAVSGEEHVYAKLTFQQAVEIKRRAAYEDNTALAREFGVSRSAVYCIKAGRTWKGVG